MLPEFPPTVPLRGPRTGLVKTAQGSVAWGGAWRMPELLQETRSPGVAADREFGAQPGPLCTHPCWGHCPALSSGPHCLCRDPV